LSLFQDHEWDRESNAVLLYEHFSSSLQDVDALWTYTQRETNWLHC
jgi:hypothetical protein